MRIVDWSSDVCSSDLGADPTREVPEDLVGLEALVAPRQLSVLVVGGVEHDIELSAGVDDVLGLHRRVPVVAPERTSVVWGKSVSVGVDLGGGRNIKNKRD